MWVVSVFTSVDKAPGLGIQTVNIRRLLHEVTVVEVQGCWMLYTPWTTQIITERKTNGITLVMGKVEQVFCGWSVYPVRTADQRGTIDIPAQLRECIGADDRVVCQVDKIKHNTG